MNPEQSELPAESMIVWDRGNMRRGPQIRQALKDNPQLTLEVYRAAAGFTHWTFFMRPE